MKCDVNDLQEKEYKEAVEAFNEKNKEKAQLVTRLMEVILLCFIIFILSNPFFFVPANVLLGAGSFYIFVVSKKKLNNPFNFIKTVIKYIYFMI